MPRRTPGNRDFELFFCEGSAFQNGIALLLISFPADSTTKYHETNIGIMGEKG